MAEYRGKFILFEGLDRCGKTTQAQRLVDRLNQEGESTVLMKFPDRTTKVGDLINAYLTGETDMSDRTIHMLFVANRWEQMTAFHQYIHGGVNVVVDRFSYSGIAYSAAKSPNSFDWCAGCEEGLPKPDVMLFMDMEGQQDREGWGVERYEQVTFQQTVRGMFARIMSQDTSTPWNIVNAGGSRDDVEERVREAVDSAMMRDMGPLKYM